MPHYIEFLISIGFLAALMWGMLKFMLRDIHRDLSDIKSDIHEIKQASSLHEAHIDHLYEENKKIYKILIDLVQKK
jgi:hypothetical protein